MSFLISFALSSYTAPLEIPGHQTILSADLPLDQLRNGLLISLPPRLIRRLKSHFHHIPPPCGPIGVDIILGLNGFVWISSGTTSERREGGEGFDAEAVYSDKNDVGTSYI